MSWNLRTALRGAKPLPEVRGLAPQSRTPPPGPIQPAGRGSHYTQLHFCAAKETAKPVRIGACVLYTTSLHSIELGQALRSGAIIRVSGKPDGDLESQFSSYARAICVFTFLSTAPTVASQRAKPRKTPFIRHMNTPDFMILTNPPSRSTVQDDVLRGYHCKRCFPERGLRPVLTPTSRRASRRLQEMLPRKGIATTHFVVDASPYWACCKKCFPERGLRHESLYHGPKGLLDELQEMLPRKGIATLKTRRQEPFYRIRCKKYFPERGLPPRPQAWVFCFYEASLRHCLRHPRRQP